MYPNLIIVSLLGDGVSLNEDALRLHSNGDCQVTSTIQTQMLNLREELSRLQTSLSSLETTANASVDDDQSHGDVAPINSESVSTTSKLESIDNQPEQTSFSSHHLVPPCSSSEASLHSSCDGEQQEPLETRLRAAHAQLSQKEKELEEMEQKYRGYLWKAREVIRTMHSQQRKQDLHTVRLDGLDAAPADSSEISRLRGLLVEKETIIENLEVIAFNFNLQCFLNLFVVLLV